MEEYNFTSNDFKLMKKDLKLNNEDVAHIIGTTLSNVKKQTNSNVKLATWAKSMIYVWKYFKS